MGVLQTRGGIPRVKRDTATTTGRIFDLPFYTSSLIVRNQGANVLRMFFTEDDFDNDANFVVVPIADATTPHGEWAGPVETDNLWFKSVVGNTAMELVVFQRRG